MSDDAPGKDPPLLEVESNERWLTGKSQDDLLVDLKTYLSRLRDNPRSIPDRLRVAAIQLKLGRTQEALIHYEGVLRGYVQEGRVMNAIALCQRILGAYPQFPRIQRILAALYARAPHGATGSPSPVTPIKSDKPMEEIPTKTFVVEDDPEETATDRNVEVQRVFPDVLERQATRQQIRQTVPEVPDERTTVPYPQVALDEVPTYSYHGDEAQEDTAVLLTNPKDKAGSAVTTEPAPPEDDGELVVLLTKKKKKK